MPQVDCIACTIRRTGFCGMLADNTHMSVADSLHVQVLPPNRLLWDDERPAEFVGILQSGYLRFERFGADGRRQILCLLQPGDIIGDPLDHARGYSVETATPVRFCRFADRRFERLVRDHPQIARAVYRARSARLEKLRWLTWSLGVLSAEERLCAFLATATAHMPFQPEGAGGTLTIPLPRRDIADLLATSVESISRITQKLAAERVIDILSPDRFRIPDLRRLVERGGLEGAALLSRPAPARPEKARSLPRAPRQ
jgi:CRP/FNR family transcriptional regulator